MKKIIVAAMMAMFAVAAPAQAGIFDKITDAVTGHVTDIKDRITHDDEYVSGTIVTSAKFRGDDVGRDPAHWTDGTVSLVERDGVRYLQFADDFNNGLAPDLYIYVADRKVVDEGSFWAAETVEVSKLASGSGAQFYELPADFSVSSDFEVVIWCKRFGAFMGAATLDV